MSFIRRLFSSGIKDDDADLYRERAAVAERKIADQRDAMYKAVFQVGQTARVFQNAAGETRMVRGKK